MAATFNGQVSVGNVLEGSGGTSYHVNAAIVPAHLDGMSGINIGTADLKEGHIRVRLEVADKELYTRIAHIIQEVDAHIGYFSRVVIKKNTASTVGYFITTIFRACPELLS